MDWQRLRLTLSSLPSSQRLWVSSLIFLLAVLVYVAYQRNESSISSTSFAGQPLVAHEIRYRLPEAGEVFLVWGINGWSRVPSANRPHGTIIRDEVMFTPMTRADEVFMVRLRVPVDASIDYAFWVTRTANGVETDIWDLNDDSEREYRAVAVEGSMMELQARTSAQNEVAARALAAGPQQRELSWMLIGLGLVAGGLSAPYLSRFRSIFKPSIRWVNWQLGIILVGAVLMRTNYITQPFVDAFSWRQVSVAMMAENYYRTNPNIFYPEVNWSGPGPNYQGREFQTVSYTAALLYPLTGQQDWVGRGIAIVFGLWGIFALYQLVRRVWSEGHAILAAGIMAVLPGSIIVERSFLPDPAMVALVVTSFWLLVVYLQTERWRFLLLASLIGAVGFCTKVPGLIVGLPMAYSVFAILGWRGALRPDKLIALSFFAVVTLVPVVAYYSWARHLALTYPPYHFAGDGNWLWQDGLHRWLGQTYFLPGLISRLVDWLWSVPVIVLVAIGLIIHPPAQADPSVNPSVSNPIEELARAPWLFHVWLLAGVTYYLIGAQELVKNPWNFHILNPMAAALAAHALIFLGRLASRITRRSVTGVVALASLFVIGSVGYKGLESAYYPYAEEAYHLGLAMREISDSSDLVITVGNLFGDPIPIYYSGRRGWGFPPPSLEYDWTVFPEDDDVAIQLFDGLRTQGADWLGIVNEHYEEIWQEHPKFAAYIERTCVATQSTRTGVIYRILSPEEASKRSDP